MKKVLLSYGVPFVVTALFVIFGYSIPDADFVDKNEGIISAAMIVCTYLVGYFYSHKKLGVSLSNLWPVWALPVIFALAQIFFNGL
jgi:hypothetical protein